MISPNIVEAALNEKAKKLVREQASDLALERDLLRPNVQFAYIVIGNIKRYALLYEKIYSRLVIVAAFSIVPDHSFLKNIWPHIEALAIAKKCDEVEFLTSRNGMMKRGVQNGYDVETVSLVKRLK